MSNIALTTTTNLNYIVDDLKTFDHKLYHVFGIFIDKKDGYKIRLYKNIHNNMSWSIRSEIPGNNFHIHSKSRAPLYLIDMITKLLDSDFEYVYNKHYFDKFHHKII
jgi:hypothetical protein